MSTPPYGTKIGHVSHHERARRMLWIQEQVVGNTFSWRMFKRQVDTFTIVAINGDCWDVRVDSTTGYRYTYAWRPLDAIDNIYHFPSTGE